MSSRRLAREQAVQILYQADLTGNEIEDVLALHWQVESNHPERDPPDPQDIEFASALVRGVAGQAARVDELIGAASINWKVQRMSYVDRNILRVAVFEFIELADIPPMVSINEAIELGKRLGTTESGAFINGILDKIRRNLEQSGAEARQ
jgi:N utilization substance protein B